MLQIHRRPPRALALWGPRARGPPAQEKTVDSGVSLASDNCQRRFAPMGVIGILRNE